MEEIAHGSGADGIAKLGLEPEELSLALKLLDPCFSKTELEHEKSLADVDAEPMGSAH